MCFMRSMIRRQEHIQHSIYIAKSTQYAVHYVLKNINIPFVYNCRKPDDCSHNFLISEYVMIGRCRRLCVGEVEHGHLSASNGVVYTVHILLSSRRLAPRLILLAHGLILMHAYEHSQKRFSITMCIITNVCKDCAAYMPPHVCRSKDRQFY